jgi:hypothetical protein
MKKFNGIPAGNSIRGLQRATAKMQKILYKW